MKNRTLCVIPARGGSKRIPHKNILDFMGKPIIAYSIEAANQSGIADVVMVSTDDKKIADVARQYGAEVPFMRNQDTSDDKTGIADVLIEVVKKYNEIGKKFDYIICLLATAPLIQAANLKKAFEILIKDREADSICSVEAFSYPPQRSLVLREGKLIMLQPQNYYARSQDLERLYHDCGQFFIFKTEALLTERKLYTQKMLPFILNEMQSQDIDNRDDWKMAELKYRILHGSGK